ncbi:MAG TPA: hypothetical protein VMG30_17405 [Acidobacteriota bacterium]|nr:hypothetical protein [Acidobacteriota bacterium]
MKIRISKWYLDCVDESGNFFIGYTASLSFGFFPLHLVSRLTCIHGDVDQRTSSTWLRHTDPVETASALTWTCPKLHLKGTWMPLLAPISRNLFKNERGSVLWHCAQPLSEVDVAWNGIDTMRGFGYAERLELTIVPGDIGLSRLRWGRFTAPGISVIWIQWSGRECRSVVLLNGNDMDQSMLSADSLVMGDNLCLRWSDSASIRSGRLETSVLGASPVLKKVFPSWITNIHETKWRSRGRLFVGEQMKAEGWIIHETVDFDDPVHSRRGCGEVL